MRMRTIWGIFLLFVITFSFGFVLLGFIGNINPWMSQKSEKVSDSNLVLGVNDVYAQSTGSSTFQTGIFIEGNYVFMSAYGGSTRDFIVTDVTDPTNPGPNYYLDLGAAAQDVYIDGNFAYVANSDNGMSVVNLTDPTTPTLLTNTSGTDPAYGVQVAGDFAYLAMLGLGLGVVDISNPSNLPAINTTGTTGSAVDVFVSGDCAYISNGNAGLAVMNISDPTAPALVATEPISGGWANGIYVSGDYCYLAIGAPAYQLAVFDISDPTDPSAPSYRNLDPSNSPQRIDVVGDFCYIAQMFSGLAVVDISDPMNPGEPVYQKMYQNRSAMDVVVAGEYAYIAIEDYGMNVVKIGEVINPEGPYTTTTLGTARRLVVSGDYAFVADLAGGLASINISDPTNPNRVSSQGAPSSTYDVYIDGDYAFVTSSIAGLSVYNITDPNNIDYLVTENTAGNARGVFISGDYAYVADWNYLAVLDISDPTNPEAPINFNVNGSCWGVYVSGDFAYTACGDEGLAIFNNSDPLNLGVPVYKNTNGYAYNVFISGDFAFVADSTSGLAIINISDPLNPGDPVYAPTSNAQDVYVYGDIAYVADYDDGLMIINITDPNNPNTLMNKSADGKAYGVFVYGDYAYLGDGNFAAIRIMIPWYAVNTTILDPITPNLDNDGIINLNWTSVENATIYYIYRENVSITTMTGLTPIGTTTNINYVDYLTVDGQYHYAVSAGNSRGKGWISNSEQVNVAITFLSQGSYGTKSYATNDTYVLTPQPLPLNEWYGFYLGCTGSYDYNLVIQRNGVDFHSSTLGTGQDDWVLWYPGGNDNTSAVITYASGDNTTYQYQFMNTTTKALGPGYFTRWFAGKGELLQFNVPSTGNHYMKLYNSSGIRARLYGPALPDSKRDASYVPQLELINSDDSTNGTDTWLAASGLYVILINRVDNGTSYRNYTLEFSNDASAPTSFDLVSPTKAVTDQTPTVICDFWDTGSGVDVSSVEYAYSTEGFLTPNNWVAVDGVFLDSSCTIPAQDYDSGTLYAKVNAVPFNQVSDTNNTIRFRARDMVFQQGTQNTAFTIIIDTLYSVSQNDYGINQLTHGNDTYLLNPQPLPTGWCYGFYLGINGTQDYDLMLRHQYIDWRLSTSAAGEDEWMIWYPGSTYIYTAEVRYVSGSNTTYQYQFLDTTFISASDWYHRSFTGRGELLQVNLASFGDYALKLNNSPGIRVRVYGPFSSGIARYASGIGPNAELYASNSSLFATTFSASGTYALLITREDYDFNGTYSLFLEKDDLAPENFALHVPTGITYNTTPTVICNFTEEDSGIDLSSVEYAYATDGDLAPTNWVSVDGVYVNPACTIPAQDGSAGVLYAKVDSVPFNQASMVNNTIRFRATDLSGRQGTQSTAFNVTIDQSQSLSQGDFGELDFTGANDNYTLNPQPLPTGQHYGFFISCNASDNYDLMIRRNNSDWGVSQAGVGEDDWAIWYSANYYNYTAEVSYISGPNETYQYNFLNNTAISTEASWQVRSFFGKGTLLEVSLVSATTYTLRLTNSANIRVRLLNSPGTPGLFRSATVAAPAVDLYAPDSGGYAITFSVGTAGTYALLVNLENDDFNANYTLYINDDTSDPTLFSIDSPTDWVNNQTPTVIGEFAEVLGSGIDISTVEYAYATDGNLTPDNWQPVDGVFLNSACTIPASDYDYGWLYAKVDAVPFGQDSETENTIRFRAMDIVGNLGTQINTTIIKIDTREPQFFMIDEPTDWVTNQTPRVSFAFNELLDGLNVSTVEYSYSTDGNQTWSGWAPVDGVYNDSGYSTPALDGETGWAWGEVLVVLFNQDSENQNTIRFRAMDLAGNLGTSDNFTIKIDSTAPQISVQSANGTYYNSAPTMDVDFSDTYTLDDAYYRVDSFIPIGTNATEWIPIFVNLNFVSTYGNDFVMSSSVWNNLSQGSHTVYFKVWDDVGNINDGSGPSLQFFKDTSPPSNFTVETPTDWLSSQTPTVYGAFYLNGSGINISSVQYAYAIDGNLTPTNWTPILGVYNDSSFNFLAQWGDTGWLYILTNPVPFNQDSDSLNTLRLRAADMVGNLGTQSSAEVIKIDTAAPTLTINNQNGTAHNNAPMLVVPFSDIYSVDSAYFKIDSFTPTGINTTGWNAMLFNYSGSSGTLNQNLDFLWATLSEGSHILYVKIWDDAGNVNDTPSNSWQFYKDSIKPNVTEVETLPVKPIAGDTINISITVNDSGVIEFATIYFDLGKGWDAANMTPSGNKYDQQISTEPTTVQLKYYIIINDTAGNKLEYGSSSNPFLISFAETSEKGGDWLIYVIIIGAIAAVAVTMVVLRRRKPSPHIEPPFKLVPPKAIVKRDVEGMINHLRAKEITIEAIPTLQDAELDQLLKESLQSLSPEDLQLLQSNEFNELSIEEKEEIFKDMILLSKAEKQELVAKLKELSEELGKD